jgi:hypothetical protein
MRRDVRCACAKVARMNVAFTLLDRHAYMFSALRRCFHAGVQCRVVTTAAMSRFSRTYKQCTAALQRFISVI